MHLPGFEFEKIILIKIEFFVMRQILTKTTNNNKINYIR